MNIIKFASFILSINDSEPNQIKHEQEHDKIDDLHYTNIFPITGNRKIAITVMSYKNM